MSNIDFEEEEKNEVEFLSPTMKPYDIKALKMIAETQMMEIESDLLLESFKNKMKRYHKNQNKTE